MNILDLYTEDVAVLPRRAGAEYQGPCPGCGGTDRFCMYPAQGSEKAPGMGTFHCGHGKGGNGCGKGGDAIQYLMDFRDLSFRDACLVLGVKCGKGSAMSYKVPVPRRRQEQKFVAADLGYPAHVEDPETWSKKGLEFVERCHEALLVRKQAIDYLAGRGISLKSIKKYRLGFNAGQERKNEQFQPIFRPWVSWGMKNEKNAGGKPRKLMLPAGLVIPYIVDGRLHRLTIRLLRPDQKNPRKKYHYVVGSMRDVWLSNPQARAFVVAEAELDCIAVDEAAGDLVGTIGLGSTGVKPEKRAAAALGRSLCILNSMDYDLPGAKAGTWWEKTYPQTRRWPVPEGKDPGEAFAAGVDLRLWVLAGLPPVFQVQEEPAAREEKISGPDHADDQPGGEYRVMTLTDGREICLTDDQEAWRQLAEAGEVVFSGNELRRLQLACVDLSPDEAAEMKKLVLDAKEVFGAAYIYRGGSPSNQTVA